MRIEYLLSCNEWFEFPGFVQGLQREYGARSICDVGGGANPVLPQQFVSSNHLDYTILDISEAEVDKAPEGYQKLVQDIETEPPVPFCHFDLIVSKMLAEHLKNGRRFHQNVFSMLQPGGIAVHYFPTLYTLPFLVNKLVSENISSLLLDVVLPRDRYRLGKFRAYYSWCYGPTPAMLRMLTGIGYEIVLYKGFFGSSYYSRIPILRNLHRACAQYLAAHPTPYLTSFAQVILRKPQNERATGQA